MIDYASNDSSLEVGFSGCIKLCCAKLARGTLQNINSTKYVKESIITYHLGNITQKSSYLKYLYFNLTNNFACKDTDLQVIQISIYIHLSDYTSDSKNLFV